jgi:hypothetical protein
MSYDLRTVIPSAARNLAGGSKMLRRAQHDDLFVFPVVT